MEVGRMMQVTSVEIKAGVKIRKAHGHPHIWVMLEDALDTAPMTSTGTIVMTEAWRMPRHSDDAHTWCNAFDWRIHNLPGDSAAERIEAAWAWVRRMRAKRRDPRYQFAVHGMTDAQKHIHQEFDPRK